MKEFRKMSHEFGLCIWLTAFGLLFFLLVMCPAIDIGYLTVF